MGSNRVEGAMLGKLTVPTSSALLLLPSACTLASLALTSCEFRGSRTVEKRELMAFCL